VLIVMSGLPGVGKTAISRELAKATGAVHLRIDSIEQALRAAGWAVEGEGYGVAQAVAADNLALGRTVIADCVNPWPLTRSAWRAVAGRAGVAAVEVEIVCSDVAEHRRRVESRQPDIDGHQLPTWTDVVNRDYRPWDTSRIIVDTARRRIADCAQAIASALP
jgi:predicted kinase